MTGVSIGVMRPDPKPVMYEDYCPGCKRAVRGTGLGAVGEVVTIRCQCGECGTEFHLTATAKELDS